MFFRYKYEQMYEMVIQSKWNKIKMSKFENGNGNIVAKRKEQCMCEEMMREREKERIGKCYETAIWELGSEPKKKYDHFH